MSLGFIDQIAGYVQKYSHDFGICVHSPIVAQSILESASGTSELAVNAHNYFGLKYRAGRCPSAIGIYHKIGSEQNADGSYSASAMQWCKFANMEDGVKGYFEFINVSRYANLKGVTDPEEYLQKIKENGYATSLKYVSNLMSVIEKYNLTKYDPGNAEESQKTEGKSMKINVHAGHNPDGKVACGAIGLIKESTEARKVKNEVIRQLRALGHTVYDCTVDDGTSQSDVLQKIVAKCNAHDVNLDVSIHFNAGAADKSGNNKTTGTEALIYSVNSAAKPYAQKVVAEIGKLGFRIRDDAVKDNVKSVSSLYVLKQTKAPAMLIECCFVDDADDVALYNARTMANAIVKGIAGETAEKAENGTHTTPQGQTQSKIYRVQCGAFSKKEKAEALRKKLSVAGFDAIIV